MSTAPVDVPVLIRHKMFGVCEATKAGDVEEDAWYHPSKGSIGAVRAERRQHASLDSKPLGKCRRT